MRALRQAPRRRARSTRRSTPAPPSSRRARRTTTRTLRRGDRGRAARDARRCSSSARARTASARASSSTTPACTRRFALRDAGYETVMVNCNPETVSTDYDTSDRLYFEPLTLEDVLEVVHAEPRPVRSPASSCSSAGRRRSGSPSALKDAGVPILGTSPEAIDLAEDRGAFAAVLAEAGLPAPSTARRRTFDEARAIADAIGYPVLVRPCYVLGGRGMEIVYDDADARRLLRPTATDASARSTRCSSTASSTTPSRSTSTRSTTASEIYVGGRHGAHRGGRHPLRRLGLRAAARHPRRHGELDRVRSRTEAIARGVGVRGLLNVQFALGAGRALRAGGQPAGRRARCRSSPRRPACRWPRRPRGSCSARPSPQLRAEGLLPPTGDGATLPADAPVVGQGGGAAVQPVPHHRGQSSTAARPGDALDRRGDGHRRRLPHGVRKSQQAAAYGGAADQGQVFVSVADRDKRAISSRSSGSPTRLRDPRDRGHRGGAAPQRHRGDGRAQVQRGRRPDGEPTIVDLIIDGEVDMVVNTPWAPAARADGYEIRTAAVDGADKPCITTVQGWPRRCRASRRCAAARSASRSLQEHARRSPDGAKRRAGRRSV